MYMCVYIYIYINRERERERERERDTYCAVLWRPEALDCRVPIPPEAWSGRPELGNFTSQDFYKFPRSFCADSESSSPQISSIPFGHVSQGGK